MTAAVSHAVYWSAPMGRWIAITPSGLVPVPAVTSGRIRAPKDGFTHQVDARGVAIQRQDNPC